MKKYIVIIALSFISLSLIYQWQRTEKHMKRLELQRERLRIDRAKIAKVNAMYPQFQEEQEKTEKIVQLLSQRIPLLPGKFVAAEDIIKRFAEKNIELELDNEYSVIKNKELYQQIELQFIAKNNDIDSSVCHEIFADYERLVHWFLLVDVGKKTLGLKVVTYSVPADLMPRVEDCPRTVKGVENYWPFHSLVRDSLTEVVEECQLRNEGKDVLLELVQLEKFKKYIRLMCDLVNRLDSNKGEELQAFEKNSSISEKE